MNSDHGQPEYLSQGVDYLGFLSQQLGDLHGVTTLVHELIQNADDAKNPDGELAATAITFDVRDDALVIKNDAVFRDEDFRRLRSVASGDKRHEQGARTTGAFGVGFISVYQVTDCPEILSAGRHWILHPEEEENRRVTQYHDNSITAARGTEFRLPWAFKQSMVREKLRMPTVLKENLDSYSNELAAALPNAILFLKKLEVAELRRNRKLLVTVTRVVDGDNILVDCNGSAKVWHVIHGKFKSQANALREQFGTDLIDPRRLDSVRIAIPDASMDTGLLFATLPTEETTGLPFHIDADFFPDSDRKHIVFGSDYRSEWNRAAVRAAAASVAQNLVAIRMNFDKNPSYFWSILDRLYHIHQDKKGDIKKPIGTFWEEVSRTLRLAAIVYTESGEWRLPSDVRIPTGEEEEEAVPVFAALGIGTVHEELRRYRNILTGAYVGVRSIGTRDIHEAFVRRKMVGQPVALTALPKGFQTKESLQLLWKGIRGVLGNTRGQAEQDEGRKLMANCSLVPGADGRLWPCSSVYLADCSTQELFSTLLPQVTFYVEKEPLFDILCSEFLASHAISILEQVAPERFESLWQAGKLDPAKVVAWFDENKVELHAEAQLKADLAAIPIFPAGGRLRPLQKLWLPGGFEDPLKVAELVDMYQFRELSDFLRFLGAKELTLADYAKRYIPQAFLPGAGCDAKVKRELVYLLAKHLGQISEDNSVRAALLNTSLIECDDGIFRKPTEAYLLSEETRNIFGELVSYARSAEKHENATADLYHWLQVADRPRASDVIRIVGQLAGSTPSQKARNVFARIIDALGKEWVRLPDTAKANYESLRRMPWLPAEGDGGSWHRPAELHATYFKHLFESQGMFLEVPVRIQKVASSLLTWLGVRAEPTVSQVIKHLQSCSSRDAPLNPDVYRWLNERAQQTELQALRQSPCLHLGGKYVCPEQVFWGSHPFGRFRIALGPEFQQYSKLLTALGIRPSPDYNDALNVLKEVAKTVGHGPLGQDRDVVLTCWDMVNEALQSDDLSKEQIRTELCEIDCVPNTQDILVRPLWMFFADRPDLADKFQDLIRNSTIVRPERVWRAMAAAGIRPVSEAITATVIDASNQWEDNGLRDRVVQRSHLIRRLHEEIASSAGPGNIAVDGIRFLQAEKLTVEWTLTAFNRTKSETSSAAAFLDRQNGSLYFTVDGDSVPRWESIARELAHVIAPGVEIGKISPGISIILEASDEQKAISKLNDLGIAHVQEVAALSVEPQPLVKGFDQAPEPDQPEGVQGSTLEESLEGTTSTSLIDEEEGSTGDESYSSDGHEGAESPEPADDSFPRKLFEAQTLSPTTPQENPVVLPPGGPKTDESAKTHTQQTFEFGRSGHRARISVTRWKPSLAAERLAEEFLLMAKGDYASRCQICSRSFRKPSGDSQVFVVHLVEPRTDRRANHFGDLASLCGWHYALIQYGQWAFIDPKTKEPADTPNRLKEILLNAAQIEKTDEAGNVYVGVPMRFWNIYQDWNSQPVTLDEELRYSIPHLKYLNLLLSAGEV